MRPWTRTSKRPITFEAFGVPIALALDDRHLNAQVQDILPPGWRPCAANDSAGRFGLRQTGADGYEVRVADEPWMQDATLEVALGMLDAQIRLFIAANARDRIFVHAGVVARDGRALVIPGESFSGKTTLVAALVAAGAAYYSDEYAVLDHAGAVHPYARRLSIRGTDAGVTRERHVGELGGVAADESAGLAAVVVTQFRPGAEWQPKRLSSGQGMLALLANTVPAQEHPEESLRAVSRAITGAIVLEGERGEAATAAPSMLEALDSLSR